MLHDHKIPSEPSVQKPHTPPGGEHPHPTPPDKPRPPEKPHEPITIIVNGVDKVLPVGTAQLSYEDVVRLAFGTSPNSPNTLYTVVFSNGPVENRKGTMVKGSIVHVKKGMIFNVGCSNKS